MAFSRILTSATTRASSIRRITTRTGFLLLQTPPLSAYSCFHTSCLGAPKPSISHSLAPQLKPSLSHSLAPQLVGRSSLTPDHLAINSRLFSRCSRGPVTSLRYLPPADYIFRLNNFSAVLDSEKEYFESAVFESSGYKWKLCLFPNGISKQDAEGHVSLYLSIAETESLPHGWEVYAKLKMFVIDQKKEKYLTIHDGEGDGLMRRFHSMKAEWGFDQLISLDTLTDAANGYLLDDSCAFGVEIYVHKYSGNGESLTIIKDPKEGTHTWAITGFSGLPPLFSKGKVYSEEFFVQGHKWKLVLYPLGYEESSGKYLSLFLELCDAEDLPLGCKVYAKYKLMIKNQNRDIIYKALEVSHNFSASQPNWGFPGFVALKDLKDRWKGLLVNDIVTVKAQITMVSVIRDSYMLPDNSGSETSNFLDQKITLRVLLILLLLIRLH